VDNMMKSTTNYKLTNLYNLIIVNTFDHGQPPKPFELLTPNL